MNNGWVFEETKKKFKIPRTDCKRKCSTTETMVREKAFLKGECSSKHAP